MSDLAPVQWQMPSLNSTPPSTDGLQKSTLERARAIAKLILSRYPDYAKATPEYVAGIVEILASLSERLREDAADIRIGVSAKCTFLPTVADFVKWAEDETARRDRFKPSREYIRREAEPSPMKDYNPYPALTAEFGADALRGVWHPKLDDAARALARNGRQAAAAVLGIPESMRKAG